MCKGANVRSRDVNWPQAWLVDNSNSCSRPTVLGHRVSVIGSQLKSTKLPVSYCSS